MGLLNKELVFVKDTPWYLVNNTSNSEFIDVVGDIALSNEASVYKHQPYIDKETYTWYNDIIISGTLKDKIAAYSGLIEASPPYNIENINRLLEMCGQLRRENALLALESLANLFITKILPDYQMSYTHPAPTNFTQLLQYTVESQFKRQYATMISILGKYTQDSVPVIHKKAIEILAKCLKEKPEQESIILSLIVENTASSNNSISMSALEALKDVSKSHPMMVTVILDYIWNLILKKEPEANPKLATRVNVLSYYDFLSKFSSVPNVVKTLYNHYIQMMLIYKKKDSPNERKIITIVITNLYNLITNASNLLPKTFDAATEEQMSISFSEIHNYTFSSDWSLAFSALKILYLLTQNDNIIPAKHLYHAIYHIILSPSLLSSSIKKKSEFFDFVSKAILIDKNYIRSFAILKRLLIIGIMADEASVVAILIIVYTFFKRYSLHKPEKNKAYDPYTEDPTKTNAEKEPLIELEYYMRSNNCLIKTIATNIHNYLNHETQLSFIVVDKKLLKFPSHAYQIIGTLNLFSLLETSSFNKNLNIDNNTQYFGITYY